MPTVTYRQFLQGDKDTRAMRDAFALLSLLKEQAKMALFLTQCTRVTPAQRRLGREFIANFVFGLLIQVDGGLNEPACGPLNITLHGRKVRGSPRELHDLMWRLFP